MATTSLLSPSEWLNSLGAFIDQFYEAQGKIVREEIGGKRRNEVKTKSSNNNFINSARKQIPASVQNSSNNQPVSTVNHLNFFKNVFH